MSTVTCPFPALKLWPCNKIDKSPLVILSDDICEDSIKNAILQIIDEYPRYHGKQQYPEGETLVYVVPIDKLMEAVEDYNLTLPEYAALFLPDVASKVEEIRSWQSPPEAVVAYDNRFSIFEAYGGSLLRVDVSMGDPLFTYLPYKPFKMPSTHHILMLTKEEE